MPVSRWFSRMFSAPRPLIGVVHLPPLPGSYGARLSMTDICERAVDDARGYQKGGVDGLVVENFGDSPFRRGPVEPHTVAALTRVSAAVKDATGELPVGCNVLRNDGIGALGVAVAAGLDFVRINVLSGVAVTDQGFIEGDAAAVLSYRRAIGGSGVRIFADLRVKHATQLRHDSVAVEASELVARARADAVLVTGAATGHPPDPDELREMRRGAGSAPVLVASGTSEENVDRLAPLVDGFIVGTALKRGGRTEGPVDVARVRRLVRKLAPHR